MNCWNHWKHTFEIKQDSRLRSWKTYSEWNKVLMGQIDDTVGVHQGGVNSHSINKMCANVSTAQVAWIGVDMVGDGFISCIGQADDIALVSNKLIKLFSLPTIQAMVSCRF